MTHDDGWAFECGTSDCHFVAPRRNEWNAPGDAAGDAKGDGRRCVGCN